MLSYRLPNDKETPEVTMEAVTTLPREKTNAIKSAREFLRRLLSPYNGGYKKIPSEVRRTAQALLKHYPGEYEIEKITECKKCSKILGKIE